MRATTVDRPEGRGSAVWRFLRGPRFVDLPLRAFALVMGLTAFVPGAFELDEPLYVALTAAAYVLIVVAPFLPLSVVVASAALSGVFLWQYPDFENMSTEALILATAVLFSYMLWWAAGAGTLALLAYQVAATAQNGLDGGVPGLIDLGYGWLTTCLVGVAAGFVERRIQREITRREQAARENARALETMRMRFTSDTHDTISHSLCTEAAIIRTLGRAPHAPGADRMITELALVNAEATKRLRQLVARLRADAPESAHVGLRAEARLLVSAIEDGTAAGGVRLSTTVGALPEHASPAVGTHFTGFILELATNVIRYATPGTASTIAVAAEQATPTRVVVRYTSVNSADAPLTEVPRSLSTRAEAVGGSCTVSADPQGRVVVTVTHPLELVATEIDSEIATEAVPVRDDFAAASQATPGELSPTAQGDSASVAGAALPGTVGHAGTAADAVTVGDAGPVGSAGPAGSGTTVHAGHSHRRLEGRRA
ncbi:MULTISPECIES: sensor histidine kinase [Brevibacterium]|uniref:Signal transduction histidine kinase n=1 Tax=Brevibacterium casei S18 TaxID=1229781 RepID=K9ASA8_9MICO|nr:hypothetical protein [Brevibacterium casei]EKU45517.1 hypothetical protein C272_14268 [Brevibacterium casei S18]NJE67376.1 hypothetical protein [Brevibacterium sp. LS14]QQT70442.1 hypothetical protein I6I57_06030 [Brevibacterium casei]